jgi:phosphatidylglycerol:prolipoprotein diacylglycerol transferase
VLFTVLAIMIRMGALKRPGLILGSFIAIYALARIAGELFREPDPQLGFLWGGLTMGMLLSLPMIIAGAILIMMAWRRRRRNAVDQGTVTEYRRCSRRSTS